MPANDPRLPPGHVRLHLDLNSVADYRRFLHIKALPRFAFEGHTAIVPEEYLATLGMKPAPAVKGKRYKPLKGLFDYQAAISALAIRKRKFAVFAAPGLGKTLIDFEFARHAVAVTGKRILIVAPPMPIPQMIEECERFYGKSFAIERVRANNLSAWIKSDGPAVGITNYESIREGTPRGNLGGLILSESSMLASMYGKWGQRLIEMGKGLEWKLCETGTPAPNSQIEYGNHAVFLDHFPTLNSFLARYFVNRGQTDNRWEMKPHALRPFYRSLSHWCIFLTNPATYGWKDNVGVIPPIHVHFDDVPLTHEQVSMVSAVNGDMFGTPGGITSRAKLSQLAKGRVKGRDVATNKPTFIRNLIDGWKEKESTIVWVRFNHEQKTMERFLPGCASISGDTSEPERERMIKDFQAGRTKILLTKSKILGFGMNLQVATRHVFNGLNDSYLEWYQCIKRSNRIGSTMPLNVHIPATSIEQAMIETVMKKAKRVEEDTREQEELFKEMSVF